MFIPRTFSLARRGLSTSARRFGGGHHEVTAKDVLPFNPFQNRESGINLSIHFLCLRAPYVLWVLLVKMGLFFGSAFSLPFFAVNYQLKKKYGKK